MSYSFHSDNRLPQTRLAVVSYIIVGMIGLLLLGFWKLQVIDSDKYGQMAEQNRVRSIPIIAPRGRMLDRDGRVLVDNRPSFSVLLLRDDPKLVEELESALTDLSRLSGDVVEHASMGESAGHGPAVPGVTKGEIASGQTDVDALLSGLGM